LGEGKKRETSGHDAGQRGVPKSVRACQPWLGNRQQTD
jgi:hypothetical protein